MKKITLLLLIAFSLKASAQTKTSVSRSDIKKSVKDDGKTLHITINGSKGRKEIKYDRTFTVAGMSAAQRDALVKRISDSLGVSQPSPPPAPNTMTMASTSSKTNTSPKTKISKSEIKQTVKDDGKTLHLILNSNQAGKEVKFDQTFAVAGMSRLQKEALVKHVTDSLHVK